MKLAQKIALGYIKAKLNLMSAISKKKAAEKAFDLFCTPLRKTKKKKPVVFQKAETLSFDLNGTTIRGFRWNHPANKRFLIVHGFESSSINFDRYIIPMTKLGYEVMAFDAQAHGASGGKRITLPEYVEMLRQVNKRYGPVNSYLSHSFGGLALTQFMETIPHDEKTKIVLIAPATETVTAINSFFRLLNLNDEVKKEFNKLILEKGGFLPQHYSIRRAIKHIKAMVLWFHDEDDDMTPLEDALKIKNDSHRNVEFVITTGLGHRRIYRDNKVTKRIFEFFS